MATKKETKKVKKQSTKVDSTDTKPLKPAKTKEAKIIDEGGVESSSPKKRKKKPINSELNTPIQHRTSYTKFSIKNTDNLINRARIKSIKKPSIRPELKTTKNLIIAVILALSLILTTQLVYKNFINPDPTKYTYDPGKFANSKDSKASVDNNIISRDVLILEANESRTSLPIEVSEDGRYKACILLKSTDKADLSIRIHTVGTWQKLKVGNTWLDETLTIDKNRRLSKKCSDKEFQISKGSNPIITIKSTNKTRIANITLERTDSK